VILTRTKLECLLFKTHGCQFLGMTAITVPKMPKSKGGKKNPHHGHLIKISRVNGVIGWRYSSAVKRQLEREGKPDAFRAFPRVWGQRVNDTPLVVHINEDGCHFYLEVKLQQRDWGYFDTRTGQRIDDATVRPWLSKEPPDIKGLAAEDAATFPKFYDIAAATRQGTNAPVILRDYRIDHIAELRIGGEEYRTPLWYEQQFYLPTPLKITETTTPVAGKPAPTLFP